MRNGIAGLAVVVTLAACGGGGSGEDGGQPVTPDSRTAALGEQIFDDASLSEPLGVACASCHAEGRAFSDGRAVPAGIGGALGFRNAPSLKYAAFTPAFHFDEEGTPTGGFNRDGRVDSFAEQAVRPFLTAHEMGNPDVATVVAKLRAAPYAAELRAIFGADALDDPDRGFEAARRALEAYQGTTEFRPFTSKYDAFIRGEENLSEQEFRGLALFNDPAKGNCAACHPSEGSRPLFTDFTYDNIGVPRNASIPANRDAAFFDLGICGPFREDLRDPTLCGAFKVPTLRNVALTAPYFHNGRFATLREVVDFYVTRDTNPERWYRGRKFDDLPLEHAGAVNVVEPPYDRVPGQAPALSPSEIDDVVTFLEALTDR